MPPLLSMLTFQFCMCVVGSCACARVCARFLIIFCADACVDLKVCEVISSILHTLPLYCTNTHCARLALPKLTLFPLNSHHAYTQEAGKNFVIVCRCVSRCLSAPISYAINYILVLLRAFTITDIRTAHALHPRTSIACSLSSYCASFRHAPSSSILCFHSF